MAVEIGIAVVPPHRAAFAKSSLGPVHFAARGSFGVAVVRSLGLTDGSASLHQIANPLFAEDGDNDGSDMRHRRPRTTK